MDAVVALAVAQQIDVACHRDWKLEAATVNTTPLFRFTLLAVALLFSLDVPLAAQNVVLGEYKGKAYQVKEARRAFPYIEVEGKMVGAELGRLALRKVDEYLPVFVAIRGLKVNSSHLNAGASQINNEFHFQAQFETAYKLPNVFIVLELNQPKEGKMLYLYEVGDLETREPKSLRITVPLQFKVEKGRYQIHLFSNGAEVFHSQIPLDRREAALDRMIARRLGSVAESEPKPFIGPTPEYPASLLKAKTTGQAIITLKIGANGRVHDPVVKSATAPAFGESALEAVREWRFLPRVEKGHAVESQVDIPFGFSPPSTSEEKS